MRRSVFILAYSLFCKSEAFAPGCTRHKQIWHACWSRGRTNEGENLDAASAVGRRQRRRRDVTPLVMQGGTVETETVGKDSITGGGKEKVVVIGAGWAGLAAAYELAKQVFGFMFQLMR